MEPVKRILLLVALATLLPLKAHAAPALKYSMSIYRHSGEVAFKSPEDVACGDESLFVVADTGNGRVLTFKIEGEKIAPGVEIKAPELPYPIRVEFNSESDLYVLDGKRHRIGRLSAEGEFRGYLEPRGLPAPANYIPRSFTMDGDGNVYILDIFSARVFVLDAEGVFVREIPLPEEKGFFSDVAVNFKGDVLLVESAGSAVFRAARGEEIFTRLTPDLEDYLRFPTGISTDSTGLIYVVDQNGGSIVILGQDGSFQGQQLSDGWKRSQLRYPTQICISQKGDVFIADRGNSRVQMFDLIKTE